jgi:hypothetical protein
MRATDLSMCHIHSADWPLTFSGGVGMVCIPYASLDLVKPLGGLTARHILPVNRTCLLSMHGLLAYQLLPLAHISFWWV